MKTRLNKMVRRLWIIQKRFGSVIFDELGIGPRFPSSELRAGAKPLDPQIIGTDTSRAPVTITAESPGGVASAVQAELPPQVEAIAEPLPPVPLARESCEARSAGLHEPQKELCDAVTLQAKAAEIAHAETGQRLTRIEKACETVLDEDQVTIRRLTDNVRALESRTFREGIMKPLILELISLGESLAELREMLASGNNSVSSAAITMSEAVEESVADTLSRQGVTRMPVVGLALDKGRQRIIRVEQVSDVKEGELILVERDGYEWDGQVLRLQDVTLRKVVK